MLIGQAWPHQTCSHLAVFPLTLLPGLDSWKIRPAAGLFWGCSYTCCCIGVSRNDFVVAAIEKGVSASLAAVCWQHFAMALSCGLSSRVWCCAGIVFTVNVLVSRTTRQWHGGWESALGAAWSERFCHVFGHAAALFSDRVVFVDFDLKSSWRL